MVDLELRCPPDHQVLNLVRSMVADVARRMGFHEEVIGEIEICVDEACANVIDHAYKDIELIPEEQRTRLKADRDSPHVSILMTVAQGSLTLTISDCGMGEAGNFDSSAETLEEYVKRERPRGLGLHIIRRFMDDVHLEFPESATGTRLTMTKRLETPPSSPSPDEGS